MLGPSSADNTAVVRAAGTAARIPASRFHTAFNRSPAIRHAVQIHVKAMLKQLQLGSACNALHPVEARMARWLLQLRDRVDHDVLPLTQQALSQILGVRRTTVTLLMRKLRACGAIRSDRRGQIEIDPARLAAAACECHNVMHLEVEEMFADASGPISRGGSAENRRSPGIKSGGAVVGFRVTARPCASRLAAAHSGKAASNSGLAARSGSLPPILAGCRPRASRFLAAPSPSGAGHCAQDPVSSVVLRKESPWPAAARWRFQSGFAFAPWCPPIAMTA